MDRRIALAWLALAAAAGLALIPHAAGQDGGAPQPSFLVYHVLGGPEADPLATPLSDPPSADRLPATFFDRAERADTAPENAPESAPAHYREMERRLSAREAMPAPALVLAGAIEESSFEATVTAGANGSIKLVIFEHGVPLQGSPQPYVARFSDDPTAIRAGMPRSFSVQLDPAWERGRLGAVAMLFDETGIVVQSATWLIGDAQVRQVTKGVLIEHLTASWCDPCAPADDALALLALQRGPAPALEAGEVSYFRAPSWPFYGGIALGGLAAIALFRRPSA